MFHDNVIGSTLPCNNKSRYIDKALAISAHICRLDPKHVRIIIQGRIGLCVIRYIIYNYAYKRNMNCIDVVFRDPK